MIYVSWAAAYEGSSDEAYFSVLLPRIIEDIVGQRARRMTVVPNFPAINIARADRTIKSISEQICENQEAFHLVFIHADTGGAGLQQQLGTRSVAYCEACFEHCGFPLERCITITPKHETEAWVLADGDAICQAMGYNGNIRDLNLPKNAAAAESLADPKLFLEQIVKGMIGRRRRLNPISLFSSIARTQKLTTLRKSKSFQSFEERLVLGLEHMGAFR